MSTRLQCPPDAYILPVVLHCFMQVHQHQSLKSSYLWAELHTLLSPWTSLFSKVTHRFQSITTLHYRMELLNSEYGPTIGSSDQATGELIRRQPPHISFYHPVWHICRCNSVLQYHRPTTYTWTVLHPNDRRCDAVRKGRRHVSCLTPQWQETWRCTEREAQNVVLTMKIRTCGLTKVCDVLFTGTGQGRQE